MGNRILLWGILLLAALAFAVGVWKRMWPDVEMGRRLAENNCGVCHDLNDAHRNRKGPFLWAVVDRPAGAIADFTYSAAFLASVKAKPFVWDEANLERFITDPSSFIPMTRMAQRDAGHPLAFEGIDSAANRRDVIAYLKTLK
ncbi:MAG: c-type cytochrome [Magnetococcales bacterium]|nr:c-type cytochrome [Magnetococcales bacterium]